MSGRPLTYNDAVRERILGALRAGASLRDAVGFAGVDWRAFMLWLKAGRRYIDLGPHAEGADRRFEQLAREVDQAAHESTVALTGIMRKAAEGGDWRAAESMLKLRLDRAERRLRLRRAAAEAVVAQQRAAGTHVERHEVTGSTAADEIRRRIARLADAAAAGGGAVGADTSSSDGAPDGVAVLGATGSTSAAR